MEIAAKNLTKHLKKDNRRKSDIKIDSVNVQYHKKLINEKQKYFKQ